MCALAACPVSRDTEGPSAHGDFADDIQERRQALGRAEGVGRADRVAVHGGARESGQVGCGPDLGGGHASQGLVRGDGLGLHSRLEAVEQDTQRLARRQDVEELRHLCPQVQ